MATNVETLSEQNSSIQIHPLSGEFLLSIKDPRQLWTENWFALVFEVVSAIILFQVYRNAKRTDMKSAYIILTAICAAISFEILPIIPRAGYQLWWYHQGLVNVLNQRLPSYVITLYTLVYYMAHCLTSKSNLPGITRSTVSAVCATLIMLPFLYLAPRLLILTLHVDDPIFQDRIAGIPSIQIVVLFLLFFHTSHLFHQNYMSIEERERNNYNYIKCALQSGLVAGIYTIVEQYLLYLVINLTVHANTAFCIVAACLILFFLSKGEIEEMQMTSCSVQSIVSPLMRKEVWMVFAALLFTSTLPLWLETSNLKSNSDRLQLGPCHITHDVANTSPLDITRRRYQCPNDIVHQDFDFHCLAKTELAQSVNNRIRRYTICGKRIDDPFQVFKQLSIYSASCLALCYAVTLFSFTFKVKEEDLIISMKKTE